MTESELLADTLRRLNATGIGYMLTGSMASNYWGIPRSTHDLDFVVRISAREVAVIVAAFATDFHLDADAIRAAFGPPYQFNAIDERSALKVDFWVLRDEPFEREMFSRRLAVELLGERAAIATAEDTILHKLYWDSLTPSERQLADVAGIFAVQAGALDLAYLRRWSAVLRVDEKLSALLAGSIRPKST